MPTEVQQFLHAHGVTADPAALDDALAVAIREREALLRGSASEEFSEEDLEVLQRSGVELEPRYSQDEDPLTRSIAAYGALIKTALTTAALAGVIGRTPGRVRQMLLQRELYGIQPHREWLIPSFQLVDDQLLPGLARVVSRLSNEAHPLGVQNFFLLPNEDLRDADARAMSPRDWLITGGDPEAVARMAADL
ncbi:MAG TPA: hypothetical protein VK035_00340 [Kiloniellales bacterium]|nr:hypothetical protein [Kiloniellales bacterium]